MSPQHAESTENRSYIFLQCKVKFFWNELGTSLNISGQRPYAEHRFSNCPIQFNSLNPRKCVRSHHYDKDSPQSLKHTPTPRAFYLLLIIQHRWLCHTIYSLRSRKIERKTRETWKYVHVFSRSWRLNSADSSCSFLPFQDVVAISAKDCTTITRYFTVTMNEQRSFNLIIPFFFTKIMATIAIHSVSKARWLERNRYCLFLHPSLISSGTISVQAWISLGSARMRNNDSQIFHSNSSSVCVPITTRKILRRARNVRPRRVLLRF